MITTRTPVDRPNVVHDDQLDWPERAWNVIRSVPGDGCSVMLHTPVPAELAGQLPETLSDPAQLGDDALPGELVIPAYIKSLGQSIDETTVVGLKAMLRRFGLQMVIGSLPAGGMVVDSEAMATFFKSTDELSLLLMMEDELRRGGPSPATIYKKLKDWHHRYGVELLRAGHDCTVIRLVNLPDDLLAFAQEVYDFCPATVDHDFGLCVDLEDDDEPVDLGLGALKAGHYKNGVKVMAADIIRTNCLHLWWD